MSQRVQKPAKKKILRALEAKEPKIHENNKTCMLIKGGNTSQVINDALKELHMLKKPDAILYKKKNTTRPFEDQSSVEFFSSKADASLFAFGSTSKKRPHNLVLGRLYDGHILDMAEFGINNFISLSQIEGSKCATGMKPALIFNGQAFEEDAEMKVIKNLLIDFFRGPVVNNIRLAGVEHAISFTAADDKIFIRNYKVNMKKESGSEAAPKVSLSNMGPSFDLVKRRVKPASDDLFKLACKQPVTAKPKKRKNVEMDTFGNKQGRLHMTSQNYQAIPTGAKVKSLRKALSKPQSQDATKQPSPKRARMSSDQEN